LQQGVDGLALFGNASEGYALTQDEKQALFYCVKKQVGDLPLVAAAGGASSAVAIDEINRVQRWGADIAMVNPPAVV
jgi:4-hydroxy-tetrahydrodipicolinate synthase